MAKPTQIAARSDPALTRKFGSGHGVSDLEKALRRLATSGGWEVPVALPTTRELGELFAVSNASVCRLLQRLNEEDIVWRRDNGRYYLNEARRLYERRRPYACLIRKLQTWSGVYRSIMTGFSAAFAGDRTSMLFVHNDALVLHSDTAHPPAHAKAAPQQEALTEFFRDHRGQFDGVLLDDVWHDDVLEKLEDELTNAVVVCRPSRLRGISSVSPDFHAAALLAIGHLYARGYEEIWLAIPFAHAVPIDLMASAGREAAAQIGQPIRADQVLSVATPADRAAFLARLKASRKRVGVFCLEDNMCLLLWRELQEAKIECPARVGLLSGMGTSIVTDERLSSLTIDYEGMGKIATKLLATGERSVVTVPPDITLGKST